MSSLSRKQRRLKQQKSKKKIPSSVAESLRRGLETALQYHKIGNLGKAAELYQKILQVNPDDEQALHLYGSLNYQIGQNESAIALLGRAVDINPKNAASHNNMGNCYAAIGGYERSVDCYKKALSIKNPYDEATVNLGAVLGELGKLEEAIKCYADGFAKSPQNFGILNELVKAKTLTCHWDDLNKFTKQLIEESERVIANKMLPPVTPYHALTLNASPDFKKNVAINYAKRRFGNIKPAFDHSNRPKNKKIKVGYLSADYREHPTAHLINQLFKNHNRDEFEIYAYSTGVDDGSSWRKKIEENVDIFVNCTNMPFSHIAQHIYDDNIDILVDVMGYIQNATPEIFALRPAKKQVSYLAYPGTMGSEFIDYLITDKVSVPDGDEDNYTEELLYMPGSYFCTDSQQEIADKPSREECGLPANKFIFCCFNKTSKIDEEVFEIWMDILKDRQNSILWLLSDDEFTKRNIWKEAEKRNIDNGRIIFADRKPKAEHLARMQNADLFLDCFAVNAHTTAIDALWAGLPVITVAGNHIISRASSSILSACGMDELIAKNKGEYKKLILKYSMSFNAPKKLKDKLSGNVMSAPLFDNEAYAGDLERLYKSII